MKTLSFISIRQADLLSADLSVTAVYQEENLSLTHTAVMQDTAAVLFRVKTLQRLTEVPHMHLVGLQRMLLRQDLQRSAKFSLHTQSALHTLFQ